MGGGDEAGQSRRTSVGGMGAVQAHAVVAPAAVPGEGCHRHQLDRVDAEAHELVEPTDRGVEGAAPAVGPRGEGAHVQLVQDASAQEIGRASWRERVNVEVVAIGATIVERRDVRTY